MAELLLHCFVYLICAVIETHTLDLYHFWEFPTYSFNKVSLRRKDYVVVVSDKGYKEYFNQCNLCDRMLPLEPNSTLPLSIYVLKFNPVRMMVSPT